MQNMYRLLLALLLMTVVLLGQTGCFTTLPDKEEVNGDYRTDSTDLGKQSDARVLYVADFLVNLKPKYQEAWRKNDVKQVLHMNCLYDILYNVAEQVDDPKVGKVWVNKRRTWLAASSPYCTYWDPEELRHCQNAMRDMWKWSELLVCKTIPVKLKASFSKAKLQAYNFDPLLDAYGLEGLKPIIE